MSFTTRKLSGGTPPRTFPWRKILGTIVGIGGPVLVWFRRHREQHKAEEAQKRSTRLLKKIFIILLAILLSLGVLAGTVKALFSLHIISIKSIVDTVGSDLPTDKDGFTNFLLLGQGDIGHQGQDLTDTMIIASLDPKTKSIVLISIPRDLYFEHTSTHIAGGRVNSFYLEYKTRLMKKEGKTEAEASQMAMKEVASELSLTFGIQIHRVIKADFSGFKQIVDALGGVDIDVPETIVDTTYPGDDYSYQTFMITAGPHHLDGETALKYARSRHSTSDFSRSARQQQLLSAITQRAKEKGIFSSPSTMISLYKTVSEHTEMTLTLRELLGVAKLAEKVDRHRVVTLQINNASGQNGGGVEAGGFLYTPPREGFGGAYVLLPMPPEHGFGTWDAIANFISLVVHNRDLYLQKPTLDVLNAGAKSGLARTLAAELLRYGFQINNLENAKTADLETSLMFARTETGQTLLPFFSQTLTLPAGQPPMDLPQQDLSELTILLGKDYTYHSILSLLKKPDVAPVQP